MGKTLCGTIVLIAIANAHTPDDVLFALWKQTERSEYKWNTVCEALRSKHVNEVLLAKTIRSKFVD